jgi:short-subunit dehydrogenase
MNVEGRVAVITGAASGIGKETAIAPASTAEVCDVSDEAQVKQTVQAVHERHGRIDILVNNAGIMRVKLFGDLSPDEFDRQMRVNFYGMANLIRSVVPIMQRQGRGVIVNLSSVGGKLIVPGTNVYAASKAAIYALSESLYFELKDKGIHVGVVLPGGTRTAIFDDAVFDRLGEYYRDHGNTSPTRVAKSIRGAIEKERFETVVLLSDRIYIGFRNTLPGLFRKFALSRLRSYLG